MRNILIYLLFFFLVPNSSFAEIFRNAYLSFEMPPNWSCSSEGTEWICISKYSQKSKEAVIILTAKEVGPTDSLAAFKAHLEAPKELKSSNGKSVFSKVYYAKQNVINNHPWIDSQHFNSEVENYYTRYLATVKDQIAVLVTFSGHREHYTKYSNDFFRTIQSLRVFPPKMNASEDPFGGKRAGGTGTLGGPTGSPMMADLPDEMPAEPTGKLSSKQIQMGALGLLFLALGGYLLLRRKKRG